MKITHRYLKERFDFFNELIFDSTLPEVPILLTDVKTYLGLCSFRKKLTLKGYVNTDFRLRFNTRIDLPEEIVEDTLIHEMIHLLIAVRQWKDSSPHGEIFRKYMNGINSRFKRHITIRHRSSPSESSQSIDTRPKWHVIAVVRMNVNDSAESRGMRSYVKVLPRVIPVIERFEAAFSADSRVRDIKMYVSKDPYFNRYPVSGALKVYGCNEDEVELHLTDAGRIEVISGKIKFLSARQI